MMNSQRSSARRVERANCIRTSSLAIALVLFAAAPAVAKYSPNSNAGTEPEVVAGANGGVKVLFIGNSLTYTNDLPGTLENLSLMGGHPVTCASVTRGGFALIDHLNGGSDAVAVIRQGGWHYVVLQQGPSSLPESRVILMEGAVRFNDEVGAIGGITSLYMVWPDLSRYSFFEAVRQNYKAAADTVDGLFLPAGEAWLKAWESEPLLALYGPDNFHPSPLGTFLAALVMYERITGADARTLPPIAVVAGDTLTTSETTVQLLQSAAHATNARYTLTAVDEPGDGGLEGAGDGTPGSSGLFQNYPNPFNPSTTIGYRLTSPGDVTIRIFDVLGREVATLLDGRQPAGAGEVSWNADGMPSGVYFYRLNAGSTSVQKKMIIMR